MAARAGIAQEAEQQAEAVGSLQVVLVWGGMFGELEEQVWHCVWNCCHFQLVLP